MEADFIKVTCSSQTNTNFSKKKTVTFTQIVREASAAICFHHPAHQTPLRKVKKEKRRQRKSLLYPPYLWRCFSSDFSTDISPMMTVWWWWEGYRIWNGKSLTFGVFPPAPQTRSLMGVFKGMGSSVSAEDDGWWERKLIKGKVCFVFPRFEMMLNRFFQYFEIWNILVISFSQFPMYQPVIATEFV